MSWRKERIIFINASEAEQHAATSNQRGTYRFGTDSIVFTPKQNKKIEPQSFGQRISEERKFDPGIEDPKFDKGFNPYYGK